MPRGLVNALGFAAIALGASCARTPRTADECIRAETKGLPETAAAAVVALCVERFPTASPMGSALPADQRALVVFADVAPDVIAGPMNGPITIYNGSRRYSVTALEIELVRVDLSGDPRLIRVDLKAPIPPLSTKTLGAFAARTPIEVPDGWLVITKIPAVYGIYEPG